MIYYKDYQAVLHGNKQIEEVRGSNFLQSFVISLLLRYLLLHLPESYEVLNNKLGLQFSTDKWRAVDIAIYEAVQLQETEITDQ